MNAHPFTAMLTPEEAAGLLQRFMPGRDAAAWLEHDRRYQPVLPYVQHGEVIRYHEEDVIALVRKLAPDAAVRRRATRRLGPERRQRHADRRTHMERRHSRRAARNELDRRFAVRPDRRSDLDRRIRGWVDRRCIDDRRTLS
jgi:hypothetical protein